MDEFIKQMIPGHHKILHDGNYATTYYLEAIIKNPKLPKCEMCKKELATTEAFMCRECEFNVVWFESIEKTPIRHHQKEP